MRASGWTADFHEVQAVGARWPRWAKVLVAPVRLALAIPLVMKLRGTQYDVVHVHFLSQGFLGAFSGHPYVLHAHGSDLHANFKNPLYRAWTSLWMKRAKRIIYVTPNLAAYLGDYAGKSELVPNPIDVTRFAGLDLPAHLARALVFMRLEPVKGPQAVFDAAGEIAARVTLSAVAWGPLAPAYREKYGQTVKFVEPVAHEKVPDLLAGADAVIGQMRQGVPGLSELEALAAGRVVLMHLDLSLYPADRPPVVDVASGHEIAEAIARLQENPQELARMSGAGREWVRAHHSPEAHVDALKDVYAAVMRR